MQVPRYIKDDFEAAGINPRIRIKQKVITFCGINYRNRNNDGYVFYYTNTHWHIKPIIQMCFGKWRGRLNKAYTFKVMPMEYLTSPPGWFADMFDLASIQFFDQGGWDRIAFELYGDTSFGFTQRDILDAGSILTEAAGSFFSEIDRIYGSYLCIDHDSDEHHQLIKHDLAASIVDSFVDKIQAKMNKRRYRAN